MLERIERPFPAWHAGTKEISATQLRSELNCSVDEVHRYLSDDAIRVTNQSDKDLQLPKLYVINQSVARHMKGKGELSRPAPAPPKDVAQPLVE